MHGFGVCMWHHTGQNNSFWCFFLFLLTFTCCQASIKRRKHLRNNKIYNMTSRTHRFSFHFSFPTICVSITYIRMVWKRMVLHFHVKNGVFNINADKRKISRFELLKLLFLKVVFPSNRLLSLSALIDVNINDSWMYTNNPQECQKIWYD